jgi:hypothetical protein
MNKLINSFNEKKDLIIVLTFEISIATIASLIANTIL